MSPLGLEGIRGENNAPSVGWEILVDSAISKREVGKN
jgi:hypothetical protein